MARATGAQVRAIAATAVQETLRRKVLYVIVFLVLIVGFISVSSATVLRMVAESGEKNIGDTVRASLVSSTFSLWAAAAQFLALFLGAVGLSSETGAKTIVNVLSRPVRSVRLPDREMDRARSRSSGSSSWLASCSDWEWHSRFVCRWHPRCGSDWQVDSSRSPS